MVSQPVPSSFERDVISESYPLKLVVQIFIDDHTTWNFLKFHLRVLWQELHATTLIL